MSASGEISTPQDYIGHHLNNLQLDLRTLEIVKPGRLALFLGIKYRLAVLFDSSWFTVSLYFQPRR